MFPYPILSRDRTQGADWVFVVGVSSCMFMSCHVGWVKGEGEGRGGGSGWEREWVREWVREWEGEESENVVAVDLKVCEDD